MISTSQTMLQLDVIATAFASDYMYWTTPIPEDDMKKLLANSLCFGVYVTTEASSENTGKP